MLKYKIPQIVTLIRLLLLFAVKCSVVKNKKSLITVDYQGFSCFSYSFE